MHSSNFKRLERTEVYCYRLVTMLIMKLTNEIMSEFSQDVADGHQSQHIPLVEALQLCEYSVVKHFRLIWKE